MKKHCGQDMYIWISEIILFCICFNKSKMLYKIIFPDTKATLAEVLRDQTVLCTCYLANLWKIYSFWLKKRSVRLFPRGSWQLKKSFHWSSKNSGSLSIWLSLIGWPLRTYYVHTSRNYRRSRWKKDEHKMVTRVFALPWGRRVWQQTDCRDANIGKTGKTEVLPR